MAESYPNQQAETLPEPNGPSIEELKAQRADFVSELVGSRLISNGLASSGQLDSFIIDEPTGYDALKHILVGDKDGGAHHLDTIFKLDNPEFSVVAASQVRGSRRYSSNKLKLMQGVKENGAFHPRLLSINGQKKESGSAMFPDEWSTEDVVRGLLIVAQTVPEYHDLERSTYAHVGNIEGVDIRVITSEQTGQIITGFPVVLRK
ncbi:MAG TPA: EndoU domain-containing protein [Candidatus Saccharimonadales bacterium]|jgi:hypothetical protein|nr:EndoU domain-containing protein [Candidatus Saccharimonadales bacterium]